MKKITDFRVTWTAEHEQYYPGHSLVFSEYTHSGQGVGETLREAFEDALEDLAQQDIKAWSDNNNEFPHDIDMQKSLESQVKDPKMLDWDIVRTECLEQGEHKRLCPHSNPVPNDPMDHSDCAYCGNTEEVTDENPDCSVCAGEWHFYVNVDVKVEGE